MGLGAAIRLNLKSNQIFRQRRNSLTSFCVKCVISRAASTGTSFNRSCSSSATRRCFSESLCNEHANHQQSAADNVRACVCACACACMQRAACVSHLSCALQLRADSSRLLLQTRRRLLAAPLQVAPRDPQFFARRLQLVARHVVVALLLAPAALKGVGARLKVVYLTQQVLRNTERVVDTERGVEHKSDPEEHRTHCGIQNRS